MTILHVVGARPNFIKVAPVVRALKGKNVVRQLLVHTGQHYDINMSDIFFTQLGIPSPDINLEVGSSSHAVQTAQIMTRIESILLGKKPDRVLVYGDVNSTVAAAMVSAKLLIPVGHVEAGLRSFDRTMPEEINRLLTDQLADLLFTPSSDGDENLIREGVTPEKIHLVGNVMIDTLSHMLPEAERKWPLLCARLNIEKNRYALVTLHRPSNVDETAMLGKIMSALKDLSEKIHVIFPIHPRTRTRMATSCLNVSESCPIQMIDPVGYLDFICLQKNARLVITDSGGIQEETTFLGVPCLTVRENTERPVTVSMGTNTLVGQDMERLHLEVDRILAGRAKRGAIPPLWDGRASERIADILTAS
ncbi:MAG: UDP-N-acetylglucosamine 2-epimerase (non-hydrolyzing) [Deltaproteobacteria bacterium]|mgnify:CR=1 FL=1|jgi:UDP-N-acetylglucosamine 2-epimerase (non-hydrolysing)|nr:UDP-N-acetylglucosamine 2-epimerase (non-hydrolyzing) [Deltaproteobacteria bacterium]